MRDTNRVTLIKGNLLLSLSGQKAAVICFQWSSRIKSRFLLHDQGKKSSDESALRPGTMGTLVQHLALAAELHVIEGRNGASCFSAWMRYLKDLGR
ncbi:hypothetical protein NC651_021476 [Populus alba x Populus x berolinensis]|nr:hypothetical protein NC651_021476 [Populus alba x Populus x berolinensis]